jgi:enterochelin esterase-like enzyme
MRTSTLRKSLSILAGVALAGTLLAQTVSDLMAQGQTAYNAKEFAKSAKLYLEAYGKDHKQTLALYNAACSLALAGDGDEAFKALNELARAGYNNIEMLKTDTDFESIRKDDRWPAVQAKVEANAKKNPPKPMWKPPFETLATIADAAGLEKHLDEDGSGVWLEGNVLTFLRKSPAESVFLTGGIQQPMKKIGSTDLWILQLKMDGWQKAIITYGFTGEKLIVGQSPKMKVWRGSEALPAPEKVDALQGQVIEKTYHSAALNEDRKLYIYLPPNAPKKDLPAVFLADGGACKSFAEVLEPLILAHKVRPCAIVGIGDGGYRGGRDKAYDTALDFRAKEYVNGQDQERFDKHLTFFTDEVGAYVAKEFGISTRREDRAVTGFSNGGAFSAAVAFRKPEFFGTSMPLSLGVPPNVGRPAKPLPRMFFAGGLLESFGAHTKDVYELVHGWGVESSLELYVAGHDFEMWKLAFVRMMPRVFPA